MRTAKSIFAHASMFWLLLFACVTDAHPVAQGQLDIRVRDEALEVTARVSSEQILIAGTLAPTMPGSGNDTLEGLWRDHGAYLLSHFKIQADQQLLTGRLLEVAPSGADFVELTLRYPLAAPPTQLRLRQDVLNEVEYVPGNPWEATYVVRLHRGQVAAATFLLASQNRELVLSVGSDAAQGERGGVGLAHEFVVDGIRHILTGYDHLLFVSALVLAVASLRSLAAVILAFTLAHSLTLTLSVLDIVRLPSWIVEPLIAASIVVVSLANLLWSAGERVKTRWGLAFFFGLFHGLGFAGGLLDATVALSGQTLALAIASFSVGVECGHMLIVVPGFLLCRWLSRIELRDTRLAASTLVVRAGSSAVLVGGVFYLLHATLL